MLAATAFGRRPRGAVSWTGRRRGTLRFATIAVDQLRGGSRRQPDVGPVLEWVTRFYGRMENPGCKELVPSASGRRAAPSSWWHELGHNASMRGDRNPLTGFDPTDVTA